MSHSEQRMIEHKAQGTPALCMVPLKALERTLGPLSTLCGMPIKCDLCPRGALILDVDGQTSQWLTCFPQCCHETLSKCSRLPPIKSEMCCSSWCWRGLLASVNCSPPVKKGALGCEKCIIYYIISDFPEACRDKFLFFLLFLAPWHMPSVQKGPPWDCYVTQRSLSHLHLGSQIRSPGRTTSVPRKNDTEVTMRI